ncbi:MAG: hypothetical protein M3O80_01440 [Chloroflexota bacterium]|nr:hypothetical protein [Chloroflexota bacterium]
MAARVGASRITLRRLEKGDPSVGLAVLARVLAALGLEEDLDKIAQDDALGQRLQDSYLRSARRTSRPSARS